MAHPKQVHGESELARELSNAGGRLVVVDFYADWCGPCRHFAPTYATYQARWPEVTFLKCCEADSQDAMQARGIRAFPTFHYYIKGSKVEEIQGANGSAIEAAIEKHKVKVAASFAGAGLSLSAPGAAAGAGQQKPEDIRAARLRALGAGGGNGAGAAAVAPGPAKLAKPTEADASAVAQLMTMGFSEAKSKKALTSSGSLPSDVEAALNWLVEHQDDADMDTEAAPKPAAAAASSPSKAAGAGSAAAGAGAADMVDVEAGSASEAVSDANPMTAEEAAEVEAFEAAAAADAEASGAAPPAKMTREQVEAKIKAMRAIKAEKAKVDAREREIKRREEGKKSNQMADEIAAIQRKQEYEKQRIAKEFDAKEKLRLQLEILKDKAEKEAARNPEGRASEATMAKIKALTEGKPLPATDPPEVAVKKIIKALTFQRVNNIGKTAAETIRTILGNVAKSPEEAKFRTLKLSNKSIQERVAAAEGALRLLQLLGFVKDDSDPAGPILKLADDAVQGKLELIKATVADLEQTLGSGAFN